MIGAPDKVNIPPYLADWPSLPGDHHRRNSNQPGARIAEDHKQFMGSAECPPPADMPGKRLKHAATGGAIQETDPGYFQVGEAFPALQSGRAKPIGTGFERWLLLQVSLNAQGESGLWWSGQHRVSVAWQFEIC